MTSRARQREQAGALVRGHGIIVAEFFDVGESRTVAWARRPQAAALVAALADPDRGWDAIVIGEYERAFYGTQYALMAPLFEHYGVQLWLPEAGGRVDYASEHDEQAMTVLGLSSKREVTRTSIRVRTAMAVQTREQGRYLGGRPPYGYRLADAGPHPNKVHAAWGRRAHRLEPDPETAHVVRWMFAQRLAGHRVARIARALNDAGIPCPSAADPERNPHRSRRGVDAADGHVDLVQPAVHRPPGVEPAAHRPRPRRPGRRQPGAQEVQRWNLPDGWVISDRPAHPALVSEADFIAAQDVSAARGPAPGAAPAVPRNAPVPAGRAADLRDVRAADGIGLVQRQGRLPVPPRPHQRRPAGSGPAEERLRPRGPHPAAPARPAPAADRDAAPASRGGAPAAEPTPGRHGQPAGRDRVPARAQDHPHLRPGRRNPAGRHRRDRQDHHQESKLTPARKGPAQEGGEENRRSPGAQPAPG